MLIIFGVVFTATPIFVCAAENETPFDKTDVLTDLKSSTINGKPFDITQYPYNTKGSPTLLTFVEYCYSFGECGIA